jgi:hypothetical protein
MTDASPSPSPDDDRTRPEREPPGRRWIGHTPAPKLLLEAALIVLSVLLGFALNAWQQRRAERELTRSVLANFRREIEANLATVRRIHPKHRALAERLEAAARTPHADSAAWDVFVARMPRDGLDLAPLQEAAWETASSTGALRLLDYETASVLSGTYLAQRASMARTVDRISERLLSPESFERARQETMLKTAHVLFVELSGQETFLIEVYEKALRQLPPAADSAR